MKVLLLHIAFVFMLGNCFAQQITHYTQFDLNKYGYNPAAAGNSLKSPYDILAGTRRQWMDIDNSPRTNFIYVNHTFIPKRSYRKWHNMGVYVDQDQMGVFLNNSFYLSYTFHLILTQKLTASFGVFAGVKRFFVTRNAMNLNDPAVAKSADRLYAYPDIIPGFRLYSKKTYLDISMRQISIGHQANSKKQIGNSSILIPHLYVAVGKKFNVYHKLILVPAVNMYSTLKSLPSTEVSLMAYYADNIGAGIAVRQNNFVSGIVQFRFLKNAIVGFAYDYSINRMRVAAPHSIEIMIGITPMEAKDRFSRSSNVAKCPILDF